MRRRKKRVNCVYLLVEIKNKFKLQIPEQQQHRQTKKNFSSVTVWNFIFTGNWTGERKEQRKNPTKDSRKSFWFFNWVFLRWFRACVTLTTPMQVINRCLLCSWTWFTWQTVNVCVCETVYIMLITIQTKKTISNGRSF